MDLIIEKGYIHGKYQWICKNNELDFKVSLPDNPDKLKVAEEKFKKFIKERIDEIDSLRTISSITFDRLNNGDSTVRELIVLMPTRYGRTKKNRLHYNILRNEFHFIWSYLGIESNLIVHTKNIEEVKPYIIKEINNIILEAEEKLMKYKRILYR